MTATELEADKEKFIKAVKASGESVQIGEATMDDMEAIFAYSTKDLSKTVGFWCGKIPDSGGPCEVLERSIYIPAIGPEAASSLALSFAIKETTNFIENEAMSEEYIQAQKERWTTYLRESDLGAFAILEGKSDVYEISVAMKYGKIAGALVICAANQKRMIGWCCAFLPPIGVDMLPTPLDAIIRGFIETAIENTSNPET